MAPPEGGLLCARTVHADHADLFTYLRGDLAAWAEACRGPGEAGTRSLVYATDAAQLAAAAETHAAIVIVERGIAALVASYGDALGCCFSVKSVPLGMATLLPYFDRKSERFLQWGERHPTALVHPTASLGADVRLGPFCVIGARSVLGDGCIVGAQVVIENDVRIGARTLLHPLVFVGACCELGEDCEIHPHTSIGSDGFGYAPDAARRARKIPHLGNVVIGDRVEIGANCAIDRAKLASTHIRTGAKLDNLCHIAHNCDLGEDGLYTAGFMMAGSTTIGKRFMTGGNSVVTSHLTLADDVVLAGRSTVTNDIAEGGAYGGYPLQPLKLALKTLVSLGQLDEMRRNLQRVMKHLGL
jgi:UDP-3-O-[3-hydroxymyristoyl] glucosamine N-acyltransferase